MADNIDVGKVYKHWIQMSDKDFETMQHLFQSKDFHWALFVGHIVIEITESFGCTEVVKSCALYTRSDQISEIDGAKFLSGTFGLDGHYYDI